MLLSEDTDGPWSFEHDDPERERRVLADARQRERRRWELATGEEIDDAFTGIAALLRHVADLEDRVRYLEGLTP